MGEGDLFDELTPEEIALAEADLVELEAEECAAPPLDPELAARITRSVLILTGQVPLEEMTQDETDRAFAQAVRFADCRSCI